MPVIMSVTALYCNKGTSDKIYGLVVTRDGESYSLTTFDGPRLRPAQTARRLRMTSKSLFEVNGIKNKLIGEKTSYTKGYEKVEWTDEKYHMKQTVLSIGTLPDAPGVLPIQTPPATVPAHSKPQLQPAVQAKPTAPAKPKTIPPQYIRDGERDF